MTVDELHDVIRREFDNESAVHDAIKDEIRLGMGGINARLDKINGRIERHDEAITQLRVADAFWAGGAVVIGAVIGWLWR